MVYRSIKAGLKHIFQCAHQPTMLSSTRTTVSPPDLKNQDNQKSGGSYSSYFLSV